MPSELYLVNCSVFGVVGVILVGRLLLLGGLPISNPSTTRYKDNRSSIDN